MPKKYYMWAARGYYRPFWGLFHDFWSVRDLNHLAIHAVLRSTHQKVWYWAIIKILLYDSDFYHLHQTVVKVYTQMCPMGLQPSLPLSLRASKVDKP